MKDIKIGDKLIGDSHPAFIIAEVGCIHNGNVELAYELIDKAVDAGADAIKFQVKTVEDAFSKELLDSPYRGPNSFGDTYREHKYALELSYDDYRRVQKRCQEKGIIFFATPFDLKAFDFLETLEVPVYKISSFHLTENKLIDKICETKKPVFISTGMSSLEEIDVAIDMLKSKNIDFALLQCTSSYPAENKDVHLSVIPELKKRYDCIVGYSGHDKGVSIPAASVCFGANVIEKHFTLDHTMKGTDHPLSLEPKGLSGLVERTRLLEEAIGNPEKKVLECELKNRMKNRGY